MCIVVGWRVSQCFVNFSRRGSSNGQEQISFAAKLERDGRGVVGGANVAQNDGRVVR